MIDRYIKMRLLFNSKEYNNEFVHEFHLKD